MSTESSFDWASAEPAPLRPNLRRRWLLILFVVVVFALASAGAFYAWLNGGLFIQTIRHEAAGADMLSSDKEVITDLLASQQKTSDELAAIDRAINDQQEQLRAIVSQLSSLGSKIEAIKIPAPQDPVAPLPLPFAVAAPTALTAQAAPAAIARIVAKQKKAQQRSTNPTGPISVGGAPLNTAPEAAAR